MKNSYKAKFESNLKKLQEATRTSTYLAAVCHIAGDAYEFQYDCTLDSSLDGDDGLGQAIAIYITKHCIEILKYETYGTMYDHGLLVKGIKAIIKFLS